MNNGLTYSKKFKFFLLIILISSILFIGVKIVIKIAYPIRYSEYIYKYSTKYKLDPHLVAAVINIESKYDKNAKSYKDARGLMQISPSTGEWASKELNIKNFTLDSLYDSELNIKIGCWYLSILSKQFNNNLQVILAAYNGGSGNVTKWLADSKYSKDGKHLKCIPFQETENYVSKVIKNYKIYKKIYKNKFKNDESEKESFLLVNMSNFRYILKQYLLSF